jgi:hypothetical protein
MFPKKSVYLMLIGAFFLVPAFVRADTPEKEIEKLRKDVESLRDALQDSRKAIADQQKQIDKLADSSRAGEKRSADELAKMVDQQKLELQKAKADQAAMAQEIDKLRSERKLLMEQQEKLAARTLDLEKQALKYRDMAQVAETVAKSFQERAEKLSSQLEDLFRQSKPPPYTAKKPTAPPPAEEVYRLKPQPQYLGKITIVEVTANSAVGKITVTVKVADIQKGDEVATKLRDK